VIEAQKNGVKDDGVASFPKGLHNAFLFSGFNALSFQIVLSSPMVLYAKKLGASATVLGIIAGMMPLLVIFQIPAANHIHRVGFKRFVYAGWGTRVLFIFGMALVPLAHRFLDPQTLLILMLTLLFCFNLSRGISTLMSFRLCSRAPVTRITSGITKIVYRFLATFSSLYMYYAYRCIYLTNMLYSF